MADDPQKSARDDFRRAHDNDPKRFYQGAARSDLNNPLLKPKPPQPMLVPRGEMKDMRQTVDRNVREQAMIKRSREKFEKEQADKVHSKDAFNKNSHER